MIGIPLHYRRYPSTESIESRIQVVILHGLFGMLDNWHAFATQLSRDYTVYTVDLRNHGRSPHVPEFTFSAMTEDIRAFLGEHALSHVAFIGHSLGGKVAMHTVLQYPELAERLMVVDIAPRAYEPGHDHIVDVLREISPQQMTSRKQVESLLRERIDDPGTVLFLAKNIARHKDGTLYWRMNVPVLTAQYSNILAAVTADIPYRGKTMFVRGGRSHYLSDDDWPEILRLFPHATQQIIPDAGHWVHADAQDDLLDLTRAFLQ